MNLLRELLHLMHEKETVYRSSEARCVQNMQINLLGRGFILQVIT